MGRHRYGGILLGPARFTHIETCTAEVCGTFKREEELEDAISTLARLDDLLETLREELAELTASDPPDMKKIDYSGWTTGDLAKARRVITAREKSITSVKGLIDKHREQRSFLCSL